MRKVEFRVKSHSRLLTSKIGTVEVLAYSALGKNTDTEDAGGQRMTHYGTEHSLLDV